MREGSGTGFESNGSEGSPSTDKMRADVERQDAADLERDMRRKLAEYKELFAKFTAGTLTEDGTARMVALLDEFEKLKPRKERGTDEE